MRSLLLILLMSLTLGACTASNTKTQEESPLTNIGNDYQTNEGDTMTSPTSTQSPTPTTDNTARNDVKEITEAVIKTSKGNITVKLYPDSAPKTVANFKEKATSDYYKNLTFHRVEDWVIQGGDPEGTGRGGGNMPTELSNVPFKVGSLGVARGGDIRISNDSQFFICTKDCSWLTGQYTNFGEVVSGMDVANKMAIGDKILGIELK